MMGALLMHAMYNTCRQRSSPKKKWEEEVEHATHSTMRKQ